MNVSYSVLLPDLGSLPAPFRGAFALLMLLALQPQCLAQIDIEKPPIEYSETQDNNSVTDLIANLKAGDVTLEYDPVTAYLPSLLQELKIPIASQALVFSKTSMQVRYISPRNPRAIYFNDDVYVGWVRGSPLMEISTSDPKLGAAFYTVTMTPRNAYIRRANYDCLACHTTTMTQGVPGHTVRSVHAKIDGTIDAQMESFVTDHTSPIAQRWGGWYVTGRHGDMKHMGNAFLRGGRLDTKDNANRSNLRDDFQTSDWLLPYSDIVALMVLEHQTQMHNAMTRANFTVRRAQHDHDAANSVAPDAAQELDVQIAQAAKEVVDYMLFVDEAPLTSEIKGSVIFANEFMKRGPADAQGRSLRDFDLERRLFKYPCSYLIYSSAFDTLEDSLRQQVYRQLWDVLASDSPPAQYTHLDKATRRSILEILRDSKAGIPPYWANAFHGSLDHRAPDDLRESM